MADDVYTYTEVEEANTMDPLTVLGVQLLGQFLLRLPEYIALMQKDAVITADMIFPTPTAVQEAAIRAREGLEEPVEG